MEERDGEVGNEESAEERFFADAGGDGEGGEVAALAWVGGEDGGEVACGAMDGAADGLADCHAAERLEEREHAEEEKGGEDCREGEADGLGVDGRAAGEVEEGGPTDEIDGCGGGEPLGGDAEAVEVDFAFAGGVGAEEGALKEGGEGADGDEEEGEEVGCSGHDVMYVNVNSHSHVVKAFGKVDGVLAGVAGRT